MDLIRFLENKNIRYWTSGKNISHGYIGLQCPFCGDHSNHLGIRLKDLKTTCWKCGPHNIIKLFQILLKISYIDAKAIVTSIKEDLILEEVKDRLPAQKLIFPPEITTNFPRIFKEYLRKRNFNPRELISKYKLRTCYRFGKYSYRIIIPIFKENKLVSWTSRDITNSAESKYLSASIEESISNPQDLIFNFDSVKYGEDAFLLEGPFDVFRFGDNSFAFFGLKINSSRLRQIALKKIRNLYIFYDNDFAGKNAAKYVANTIAPLVKDIHILKFKNINSTLDPAQLSPEVITKLKIDLNFNVF